MNLCSLLLAQARERPAQVAIIETNAGIDTTISFAELDARSARAAALLRDAGIARADPVLLLVPMSIDLYVSLIGILRIGAVAMLLDPQAGLAHLNHCCRVANPAALIAASKAQSLRLVCPGLRAIPRKFTLGQRWLPGRPWKHLERQEPWRDIADLAPQDPALLTFTSGSTGRPKAALRSHALLQAQQEALASALTLEPGTSDLTTLPVFVLSNLAAGVTSILPDTHLRSPGAIEARPIRAQIDRLAPSSVVASPTFLTRLADACEDTDRSMPSFRRIFTGGAPVFWHQLDALARASPNARVFCVYGSTEAEPIAEIALDQLTPEDRLVTQRGGGLPVGVPVPQVRLRIIADRWGTPIGPFSSADFAALSMAPGKVGEIVVTGQHVLKGYLHGHGDDQTKFRVGDDLWHRTGDSGYLDEHARLWLTGRCPAKVVDQNGTTYPLQIEAAAHAACNLRRSAFVQSGAERILVIEVGRSWVRSMEATLQSRLSWARLDRIERMNRIPVDRRHNAKVDYPTLARRLCR